MFRSHSKGSLAKIKSKIENRIGATQEGRKVIAALIKKGIIYEQKGMYIIDNNAFASNLGVKFDGIKECEKNTLITSFIQFAKTIEI